MSRTRPTNSNNQPLTPNQQLVNDLFTHAERENRATYGANLPALTQQLNTAQTLSDLEKAMLAAKKSIN